MPTPNGGTCIDRGLDVAFNQMFKEANGMRANVPKAVILITDGEHSCGNVPLPVDAGKKFHDAGIKVIVIGVGDVSTTELLSVVKTKSDLYLAKDFDQLISDDSFVRNISDCTTWVGKS